MATFWTNDPATSSVYIRAIHVNELMQAVDRARAALGLPGWPWINGGSVGTSSYTKASDFGDVRTAAQDLWNRRRMGSLPNWSVGTPPSVSRTISARDMNDLRSWINQYENNPDPADPQGIVSFSYDPNANATVTDSWCQDVTNLKSARKKLLIRTVISARSADNVVPISSFQAAMDVWNKNGFSLSGVLPFEFDRYTTMCPNAALGSGGNPLLNDYINDFSVRAESFANQLAAHGLREYWVWNEPNLDVKFR